MKIKEIVLFVAITLSFKSPAATHMEHFPELSIRSGVELQLAVTDRIAKNFSRWYSNEQENASTYCLDAREADTSEEVEDALSIESAVPDSSVVVQKNAHLCF